jgi:hypothetical protein
MPWAGLSPLAWEAISQAMTSSPSPCELFRWYIELATFGGSKLSRACGGGGCVMADVLVSSEHVERTRDVRGVETRLFEAEAQDALPLLYLHGVFTTGGAQL